MEVLQISVQTIVQGERRIVEKKDTEDKLYKADIWMYLLGMHGDVCVSSPEENI